MTPARGADAAAAGAAAGTADEALDPENCAVVAAVAAVAPPCISAFLRRIHSHTPPPTSAAAPSKPPNTDAAMTSPWEVPPAGATAAGGCGDADCEGVGVDDGVQDPVPEGVAAPVAVPVIVAEGVPEALGACDSVPVAEPEGAWLRDAVALGDGVPVAVGLGAWLAVAVTDGVGSVVVPKHCQPRAAKDAGREQPVFPDAAYASAAEMLPARHASLAVTEDMRGLSVCRGAGAGVAGTGRRAQHQFPSPPRHSPASQRACHGGSRSTGSTRSCPC